jgi:hypothetical protein
MWRFLVFGMAGATMHGHEYTGETTAAPSVAAVDHADIQAMNVTGVASDQLRPPAIPLILRSPYVHTWQMGDQLVGDWPRHWTGAVTPLCGIARIDGVPYVFAGSPSLGDDGPSLAAMTQTSLTITATRTTFSFTSGGVALSVEFLSCVDLADLHRQSVPASYLLVRATSVDGASHRVGVYVDVSGEWAHGDPATPITWGKHDIAGPARMVALTMEPATPTVFGESHNRASWGNTVFAADDRAGLTWEIGEDVLVRRTAATSDGLANASDPGQPRPIEDRRPVLGVNQDLGTITPDTPSAEFVVCVGHVREPAIEYLNTELPPLWRSYWAAWPDMLSWFRADLETARRRAEELDRRIEREAGAAAGPKFAAVCALALRQAVAGTELVSRDGAPWAFLKELSSGDFISTVDVIYPAFPAYLYLSPEFLRALLEPVLDFSERAWTKPFAPHDLGRYPTANGQDYPADMPVEESADLLIMAAAVMARLDATASADFARPHYPILVRWADYLVQHGLDPSSQLSTDDFEGPIARNANLALKAVIAIGAMSRIADGLGHADDAARYLSTAQRYIRQWRELATDPSGRHTMVAYDQPGSWSLKYNAWADVHLGLGLVGDAVAAQEAAWYQAQANAFGVPLNYRKDYGPTYTKSDWEMWCAAWLADHVPVRDMLVESVHHFAHTTPDRSPLTDWYDSVTGRLTGFCGRPVVGGFFAPLVPSVRPPGPLAWWSFAEGGGTVAGDAMGDGHVGVIEGAVAWTAGPTGGAVTLAGGMVTTARPVVHTDGGFTVCAWVRLVTTEGSATAVSQDGDRVSGFFLQYAKAEDRWAFTMVSADTDDPAPVRALSALRPSVGEWTHLVGLHDAANQQLRIYVDGAVAGTVAFASRWHAAGGVRVGAGKWNGLRCGSWPGAVGDVRLYQETLTSQQIRDLAREGR